MRVRFSEFTLDSDSRQLARGTAPVHLSPKAFDVLCLLVSRHPQAVNKSELYDRVWPGTYVVDANLAVLIAEVRRALGDDPKQPRFVRTVHRFGYAFCSDVTDGQGVPKPAAPAARKAWLVWNDRVLHLSEGENVLGRDPECTVWLDVPGVSRRHAKIVIDGQTITIEDLGSKNGTYVGEAAVEPGRPLVDGDAVHLGPVQLTFRQWSEAGGSETVRLSR